MAFTTMGILSFKVLWTYFSCEEPQWTPLHWIFGKPRNICPTIADLLQTLSLYFLLSAIVFCVVLKILPWLKKGYMYLQIFGETFRYARAIKESAETKGLSRKRKEVIVTIQLPSIYTTDLRERIPIYTTDLRERIHQYTPQTYVKEYRFHQYTPQTYVKE
ncbi:uncharacterized protein LOC143067322 [Mytilus galloprovincialis]|uniref:uncharacterized protein LOC143067322 n=1 Tax=Mytilus galloprovincialis TaxID=29158 RepID=UPI003F7C0B62